MMSRIFASSVVLLALLIAVSQGQTTPKTKAPLKTKGKKGAAAGAVGDWPTWRGAQRDGLSQETGLMKEWPEAGPKLLWKAEGLGEGYTTPSVVGNLIFSMGNKDGKEFVMALDKTAEGKIVWETPLGAVRNGGGGYPGPRSTPTVDGKFVYTLGLNGDLACLEAATGKGVWKHDLVGEYGGKVPNWGYSESVLIDGPLVLCTPGGDKATIAAFQKTTGKPAWAAPVKDTPGYSSLVPCEINGVKQYVQFTSSGVVAVSAKDGSPLWNYKNPANGTANISTPIVSGNMVFAASGYGTGGGLAEIGKAGVREVYFTKDMKNHHGGVLLIGDCIYGSNDPGLLVCLDFKSGTVKWSDREPGKCSLAFAEGLLYCRSENGPVTLVEASPEGYKKKGRFDQPNRSGNPAWPHPVISGGKMYLRDQDVLLCYDISSPGAE